MEKLIHQMVKRLGLDKLINQQLNVLKLYMPYSESDHVLNIAYNLLAGGTCLEHGKGGTTRRQPPLSCVLDRGCGNHRKSHEW